MMALLAAGNPSQNHYWVPDLSSIPEDEEVWLFQDPPLHLCKILLSPQCGTHHTVAADVEKFPFWHLCIKRILAALLSVPTMMLTLPLTTTMPPALNTTSHSNLPSTTTAMTMMARTPVDHDEINHQLICSIQSFWQMSEHLQQQPSMMTMTTMSPPKPTHQQDTTTTACINLPLTITATTTKKLTSNQLMVMPMMMTTMITTPSQLMLQQDSPLHPSFSILKEILQPVTIDNAPPYPLIHKTMELDQSFPATPLLMVPPDDTAAFSPTEPSKIVALGWCLEHVHHFWSTQTKARQKKTYYDYWQRGRPLALAVGWQCCLYLSTKKVCRAGSGPEEKQIRSQARISL